MKVLLNTRAEASKSLTPSEYSNNWYEQYSESPLRVWETNFSGSFQ